MFPFHYPNFDQWGRWGDGVFLKLKNSIIIILLLIILNPFPFLHNGAWLIKDDKKGFYKTFSFLLLIVGWSLSINQSNWRLWRVTKQPMEDDDGLQKHTSFLFLLFPFFPSSNIWWWKRTQWITTKLFLCLFIIVASLSLFQNMMKSK